MKGKLKLINGIKLESPNSDSTRPTISLVREALINIIRHKMNNTNWLDLYSGSGIMGCEAINNGARNVLAVEINRSNSAICKSNLNKIASLTSRHVHIDVINTDVNKFLKSGYKNYIESIKDLSHIYINNFDFVYIDPPYKLNSYSSVLDNLLDGGWVSEKCLAICEFSTRGGIDISSRWIITKKKFYGNTGLLFLTPNQALNSHDDIDSKHLQKDLKG